MTAKLNAQPREGHGKGHARKLRRAGQVPVVVYGHGDQTRSLSVDALELEKLLHTISVENTVVSLSSGGATSDVLIRAVQTHPVKAHVIHVDFIQVHADEPIKLHVPIRLTGTAAGVANDGGVLDHELHELEVECLPRDIPEYAEVDVSALGVGDALRVRDVSIPGVTVLNDREAVIAMVHHPKVHDLDAEPVAQEGVGGVEPELIRERARDEES
jgi:large subunit ribosomal protein L25